MIVNYGHEAEYGSNSPTIQAIVSRNSVRLAYGIEGSFRRPRLLSKCIPGVRFVLPIDIPMYQTSMQELLMAKTFYFTIL
ncbi:MAG: hypothetical protein WA364_01695 [Candidatus Nitrosopolaris sp.]